MAVSVPLSTPQAQEADDAMDDLLEEHKADFGKFKFAKEQAKDFDVITKKIQSTRLHDCDVPVSISVEAPLAHDGGFFSSKHLTFRVIT